MWQLVTNTGLIMFAALQLGAMGQTLVRNVKYEVPYYQQQAAKQQQQLADLEKRQTDLLKQAAASAATFRQVWSLVHLNHLTTPIFRHDGGCHLETEHHDTQRELLLCHAIFQALSSDNCMQKFRACQAASCICNLSLLVPEVIRTKILHHHSC